MRTVDLMKKYGVVCFMVWSLLSVSFVQGAVIYQDDFSDGTHDFVGGGTFTIVDDSAGLGGGNALRWAELGYGKIGLRFAETSLANTGDWISLSYGIRYETAAYGDYARLGFANDGNNDGDVFATDFTGYTLRLNGTSTYSDRVHEYTNNKLCEAAGTSTNFSSSADWRDTDAHQFLMTVTRTASGANVTIDWDSSRVFTKAYTGTAYAFDMAGIKLGSGAVPVLIDNVQVATNVPEPASLMLLALGGIALQLKNRKRTR